MEKQPWITFFSQTGSEIADLAESLGYWPTRIITNKRPSNVRTIDPRIIKKGYLEVPNKPNEDEILNILQYYKEPVITLHGWLRIMPPNICSTYTIYNGHPGLITKYPELKGKDPQIKAFNLKHDVMGCVIHRVTSGVDEGRVLKEIFFNAFKITEKDMWKTMRDRSLYLWLDFFKGIGWK